MVDRPAPLSPPECDLRGYEFMPIFGHRLFNSAFNDMANAEEFRAAMRLWWASWQQCPAGSLPNDDNALARLADFGRDLKSWAKVKEVALHGFVECSDGRLYHPLICQEAQGAFERRRKDRERKAAQRGAKKHARVQGQSGSNPDDIGKTSNTSSADCPMGQPQDFRSDRTGQDRTVPANAGRGAREKIPEASRPPDPVMVTDPETGGPAVNGFLVNVIGEQCLEAAGINPVRWRGDFKPVIRWLADGYDGNEIANIVARRARGANYTPPFSLAFFDNVVRQACPLDPLRKIAS